MSTSHSRSLPRDRGHYTPAKTHPASLYASSQRVSSRHAQSTPRGDLSSRANLQLSRSAGRPIPAWVADLDASIESRKRLSTLYTDSLLSADGHAPTHNRFSGRSMDDESSEFSSVPEQDPRGNLNSTNPETERAMSVMSAMRPPPTWIEDLDDTTETLPGSLRLLARDMDPRASRTNGLSNHSEPSQRNRRSGHSNSQSNGFSRPTSLRSDIQRPKASSRYQNSQRRHQNGTSATLYSGQVTIPTHGSNSTRIFDRGPRPHERMSSASTEDLINESPFGDGVPNFKSTTLSPSHASTHKDRFSRDTKGSHSQHPVLKQPLVLSSKLSHQHLRHQSSSIHKPSNAKTQTQRPWETSTTTATDSLIYSSPFGLDRDLRKLEDQAIGTSHLSPAGSMDTDGTMKDEEIITLSSLSSMTLQDDHVNGESGERMPNNGDLISESTVGGKSETFVCIYFKKTWKVFLKIFDYRCAKNWNYKKL